MKKIFFVVIFLARVFSTSKKLKLKTKKLFKVKKCQTKCQKTQNF